MARLLHSSIQDFVQEVPVRQMAQGYPLSVPAVAHPPRFQGLLGGGKGEVKPPKCPTRQSRVGGYLYVVHVYVSPWLKVRGS